MRTAVDTNVFSIVWRGAPRAEAAQHQLSKARGEGSLAISPVTYAELLADPQQSPTLVDHLLETAGILIDFELSPRVWRDAGLRFARYSERRRRSGGGEARRLLADFIVGSHALHACQQLMTFDTGRFRNDYPELRLIDLATETL